MYEGGCRCGKIRYRAQATPIWPHLCSCRDCQHLSGGPAMAWIDFPAATFAWTGEGNAEPQWFYTFQGIGRGFCPTCGSTLASKGDVEGEVGVTIASLDNGDDLVPVDHSFKHDAAPWFPTIDTTPH
ncbi:GFA family protein [Nocardia sp. NPDC058499]|uniref:GFA family protein n=1 Tax=Nocardia sp. NPDC058499 TaxID=3346530 RepID=UPI0036670EEB